MLARLVLAKFLFFMNLALQVGDPLLCLQQLPLDFGILFLFNGARNDRNARLCPQTTRIHAY